MPEAVRLGFNLGVSPGVNAVCGEWAMPERLAQARRLGFGAVEGPVPDDPARLRAQLDALGMAFECLSFARGDPARGELGMACLPGRQREFREELERTIDAALQLGCHRLHPLAGQVPETAQRAACEAAYLGNLSDACRCAAAAGIRIVIEPIGRHRQPRYLLHTSAQALSYIDRLGSGRLGLILDLHHARGSGESPEAIAAAHAGVIDLLQVAGWPRRCAPSPHDSVLRGTWQALARAHWSGCVSAEYEPEDHTEDSLAWMAVIEA